MFNKIREIIADYKWRKNNKHNFTKMILKNAIDVTSVGKYTYGNLNVHVSSKNNNLHIGNYCSIANEVMFILSSEHPYNKTSTYPFKTMIMVDGIDGISKGDIVIDDDVWIGYGAIIMSSVHIGQGAVVAAGAVVTKDVPPYAIVGGVPAKVIKYRFESDIIDELLKVDYSKLTKEMIEEHIDDLYVELRDKEQLKWMPKKESK